VDMGTYTCRISNKYGQAECTCSVSQTDAPTAKQMQAWNEQVPPSFVKEPPDLFLLRAGDDLIIECTVKGWPQPTGIYINL
jgi:hypothetical protein